MDDFQGRVAFVTGAASGIGLGIASVWRAPERAWRSPTNAVKKWLPLQRR